MRHAMVRTLARLGHLQGWDTCVVGALAGLGHLRGWGTCGVRVGWEQPNSETETGGTPEGLPRRLVGGARGAPRRGRRGGQPTRAAAAAV